MAKRSICVYRDKQGKDSGKRGEFLKLVFIT